MFNKRIIYSALLIVFFLLESSPFKLVSFFNVKVPLCAICVVLIAMFEKERYGAIFGLAFGLCFDIGSRVIGFNALFFMVICFAIGNLTRTFIRINIYSALILTTATVFFHNLLTYFFFIYLRGNAFLKFSFLNILAPKTILCIIACIPVYFLFKQLRFKIFNKYDEIIT